MHFFFMHVSSVPSFGGSECKCHHEVITRTPDKQGWDPHFQLALGQDEPCALLHSSNSQFAADSGRPQTSEPVLEGITPWGTHSPPVTPRSPVPPLDLSHPTHPSALSFPIQTPTLSSLVQIQVTVPKPWAPQLKSPQIIIILIFNEEQNNFFLPSCLLGNSKTCFGCNLLKNLIWCRHLTGKV